MVHLASLVSALLVEKVAGLVSALEQAKEAD